LKILCLRDEAPFTVTAGRYAATVTAIEGAAMPRSETQSVTTPQYDSVTFAHQARGLALHHGERILQEIPTTLRRVGQFLLVMAITIPLFLAGLLVVLWHLAR
jgi:hypothetical protein